MRALNPGGTIQVCKLSRYPLSTVGGRAFPVAGPAIRNSLPDNVISAPSLSTFRRRLKTFPFLPGLVPGQYSLLLLDNSLRQTVHTCRASIHQAAKLVAALLRDPRVTSGLAESNGSLPPGL